MSLASDYPALDNALTELAYSVGSIKRAMSDGHVSIDEIVTAIPDADIRKGVHDQIVALQTMFVEMGKLAHAGPWKMLQYAPDLMSRLMGVFL